MKRIGFATGYDPSLTILDMVHWVQEAELREYELAFFSETIAMMRDSVSAVSAFAVATNEITLGFTQIVRLRSPVIMAQTLASLDELSSGRIILAPGACTKSHALHHSIEPLNPVLTLTEWVEAIRQLIAHQSVTYNGKSLNLTGVGLGWKPIRSSIPFINAATSRTGLRLAGKIGDGVLLNAVTSPEYTENAVKILKEAVEEEGRDWSNFEVAQLINCSVEDDHGDALDQIRWEVASKFDPRQISFNAKPRLRVGEPIIKEDDLPLFVNAYNAGGKSRLIAEIPDSYIEGLTASGTQNEVLDKVERYRESGVKLPILRPAAAHQTSRILDLFSSN